MTELTIAAPEGAGFEFEEVKTDRGTKSLGQVPILVWNNHPKMAEHYGEQGLLDMADGTSLRVSFQSIARRFKAANKTDDEIAKAQVEFKPGKRAGGASTPASRVARAAKGVVEDGKVTEDSITKLLDAIKAGKLSDADLTALVG